MNPDEKSSYPNELIREDWDFILYDYGKENLYLSVVCGRAAVFTMSFFLKASEKKKFLETGDAGDIRSLVSNVRSAPNGYIERTKASDTQMKKVRKRNTQPPE